VALRTDLAVGVLLSEGKDGDEEGIQAAGMKIRLPSKNDCPEIIYRVKMNPESLPAELPGRVTPRTRTFGRTHLLALAAASILLAGCTVGLRNVQDPPRSVALPTAYPWNSMIYLARTDAGVIAVDLGWNGAGRALRRGLRRMGATPEDVRTVFLTHSHRDHIGAWRTVARADFYLSTAEVPFFRGEAHHADLPSRAGERTLGNPAPWPEEVAVHGFAADTAFVLGADTLRAFGVPGHTPGSAAYLFRGVLFVGDAVAYSYLRGFRSAFGVFTADRARSRASLASLWERVRPYPVRWVCTAHAKCAAFDSTFVRRSLR